jgi:hypothetical protein
MYYENGESFTGQWHNDKYQGKGTKYDQFGEVVKAGYWKAGTFDRE